jgi:hypothetical protein
MSSSVEHITHVSSFPRKGAAKLMESSQQAAEEPVEMPKKSRVRAPKAPKAQQAQPAQQDPEHEEEAAEPQPKRKQKKRVRVQVEGRYNDPNQHEAEPEAIDQKNVQDPSALPTEPLASEADRRRVEALQKRLLDAESQFYAHELEIAHREDAYEHLVRRFLVLAGSIAFQSALSVYVLFWM